MLAPCDICHDVTSGWLAFAKLATLRAFTGSHLCSCCVEYVEKLLLTKRYTPLTIMASAQRVDAK